MSLVDATRSTRAMVNVVVFGRMVAARAALALVSAACGVGAHAGIEGSRLMLACVWTLPKSVGWRVLVEEGSGQSESREKARTLDGGTYVGYSHRPEGIPFEQDVPHIIRRVDGLPCAQERVLEKARGELCARSTSRWVAIQEWRSNAGVGARLLRTPETGEQVLALYLVCLDPAYERRRRLGEDWPPLVRGEKRIKRNEERADGATASLVVECPVHHVEVCRVDVPAGLMVDEEAWRVFARVISMAKGVYDQFFGGGNPWKEKALFVKCPNGAHPVEIPVK